MKDRPEGQGAASGQAARSRARKFAIVLETATLDQAERSAYCRRQGLAPPGAQPIAIATLREHFDLNLDAIRDHLAVATRFS